ncbi:c-type cytochrome [Advenella sp. RU8]|uniref:c-type cytochrome n=1 Tax=Advenella sp. RU8 TaxID=3399575 RepID=UPI003AAC5E54
MTKQSLKRTINKFAIMASCAVVLPVFAQQPAPAGDIEAGKGKVFMCMGCHGIEGYRASFPEVYRVPKIAGQNAEYIVAALKEYQSGSRTFPSMIAIAHSLSEQDMLDLAAYYAQLK